MRARAGAHVAAPASAPPPMHRAWCALLLGSAGVADGARAWAPGPTQDGDVAELPQRHRLDLAHQPDVLTLFSEVRTSWTAWSPPKRPAPSAASGRKKPRTKSPQSRNKWRRAKANRSCNATSLQQSLSVLEDVRWAAQLVGCVEGMLQALGPATEAALDAFTLPEVEREQTMQEALSNLSSTQTRREECRNSIGAEFRLFRVRRASAGAARAALAACPHSTSQQRWPSEEEDLSSERPIRLQSIVRAAFDAGGFLPSVIQHFVQLGVKHNPMMLRTACTPKRMEFCFRLLATTKSVFMQFHAVDVLMKSYDRAKCGEHWHPDASCSRIWGEIIKFCHGENMRSFAESWTECRRWRENLPRSAGSGVDLAAISA